MGTLWIAKRPIRWLGKITKWEHVYIGYDDRLTWRCAGDTGESKARHEFAGGPGCAACAAMPDQDLPSELHASGDSNAGIHYAPIGRIRREGGGSCHQIANRILYGYGPRPGSIHVAGSFPGGPGGWEITLFFTGWLGLDPWPDCPRCDCPRPPADALVPGYGPGLAETAASHVDGVESVTGKVERAIRRHGHLSSQVVAAEYESILEGKGVDDLPAELRQELIDRHCHFRQEQDRVLMRARQGEIDEEARSRAIGSLRLQAIRTENELLGPERFERVYGMSLADLLDASESD